MEDSDLIKIFWEEVRDYLDRMNALIMTLEMSQSEDDAGAFVERLRELNRLAHSMKGAARAVGIPEVEQLGFHMEEVLEASLKRGLALTPDVADLLYDALDLVGSHADGDDIPPDALAEVTGRLEALIATATLPPEDLPDEPPTPTNGKHASNEYPAVPSQPPPPKNEAAAPPPPQKTTPAIPQNTMTTLMRPAEDTVRVAVEKLDRLMEQSSELLVARIHTEDRRAELDKLRRQYSRWMREWRSVRAAYIRMMRRMQAEDMPEDMALLFGFLDTNQKHLLDTARQISALVSDVAGDTMRLTSLTDEIQDSISSLRLVPFETVLSSLQRTLRDAARETDKEAYFDVVGANTEIDKTVLEQLKDPLMHLIRNAVDHGIEPTADRVAAGKPPAGWVFLTVEQRGSEILIHVGDDGRGINTTAVRQAAVERGIITAAAADMLTEDEVRTLIFHPGLTTRSRVSPISGRGVGMDVVRSRIESLRGRVSIISELGRGTTTTLSVPVSLTRIRSVLLTVGDEQYAVPALSVTRMARIRRDMVFHTEGRAMLNLGDQTVPLLPLADMLGAPLPPSDRDELRIVVLNGGDRSVAFEVDNLTSERELVIKPLGEELAGTRYVTGAALLGGGDVVIVLDANDLVRGAFGAGSHMRPPEPTAHSTTETPAVRLRVLIVDDSITTRTLERNILETAGCDVKVAFDGEQGWQTLMEHEFDVVVSDVEMPRLNGFELTKRIKATPTTRHLPVILLTSLNKPEHREAGLEAGADAYLVKSRFDQDELLRTIRSVL